MYNRNFRAAISRVQLGSLRSRDRILLNTGFEHKEVVVKLDFGLGMLAAAERNLPLGADRLVGVDHG